MKTTLSKILRHHPCGIRQSPCGEYTGYLKLQNHLGKTTSDDEEFSLLTVLDSNGLEDAIWCFRAVSGFEKEKRLFAVFCARQVQHLMKDPRSINAIEVAEKFANGEATQEELAEARIAAADAYAAAADAYAAADTAAAYAAAAYAATDAAAAYAAAYAAAADIAAYAAAYAAPAVAARKAQEAIRKAQEVELRRILSQ